MSDVSAALRRDFMKLFVLPSLSLVALPALALLFINHGMDRFDREIRSNILGSINRAADVSADEKAEARAWVETLVPSSLCAMDDLSGTKASPKLKEAVCESGGSMWQFLQARRVASWALWVGFVGLLGAAVLCLIAARLKQEGQYKVLRVGFAALVSIVAFETLCQASLGVWLSFWVTALFFNMYAVKLILVIGVLAAVAVFTVIVALFKRSNEQAIVDGELVHKPDAPGLWQRLEQLAGQIGTAPPQTVVAGIDDNFFVTESSLIAGDKEVSGRTLFVSLPLLRVLSTQEADAVLAHELAHFKGGDTASSAKLNPALRRYDEYLNALREQPFALPGYYVMAMFRAAFELARQAESRRRELIADQEATKATSPDALATSLLKVMAFSSHRRAIEDAMFNESERHGASLGIKEQLATGLTAHVATASFKEMVMHINVPHPFDSHPPLDERLKSVGSSRTVGDCQALLESTPAQCWAQEISTADAIEAKLWGAYEARFIAAHEQSLAYRYLPSTDEERAHVEKYFPLQEFGTMRVSFAGVQLEDGEWVHFRDATAMKRDTGNFSDKLIITLREEAPQEKKTLSINLKPLKTEIDRFLAVVGQYWQRDQFARQAGGAT